MPERKNWSQNIHYNGSKPENSRKEKIGHKTYTIMVLNQKIAEREIGQRAYTIIWF